MYFQRSKISKFFPIALLVFLLLFVLTIPSLAQNLDNGMMGEAATAAEIGGANLPTILGQIFKIVLSILGLVALIIVIIAGVQWMTSGGIPEKIKKARALLSAGLIGLLIIICAYAMVSFIISSLTGVTGENEGGGGEPHIYPQEYFRLTRGEANFDTNGEVYLCSNIRAVFNHVIKESTVAAALSQSTLKVVDSIGDSIEGDWQTSGKSILFTPTDFWTGDSEYELIIPRTISDNSNRYLKGCSMGFIPANDCIGNGTVNWDFSTNNESDETPPYVYESYPIMDIDDPLYPDRNVSRAPMIDVIFNENIDYATIIDMNHVDYVAGHPNTWHPIVNNFQLCKIADQNAECIPGDEYNNDDLLIVPISEGFRIFVTNAQWLDAFTWYEIQVDGIDDMCNNTMTDSQSWKFETNNNIPGAQDWWPKGSNVCPDALVGIRFATSMYEYEVNVEVINNDPDPGDPAIEFAGSIYASDLNPGPYEATLTTGNGSIKVFDEDDTNISNQFKIFQLELNDTLKSNKSYTVIFDTDLVMDIDGNTLGKSWDFDVTNMQDCACAPVIYQISPPEGPRKSCVTITGHCFEGTTERPATIDSGVGLWFDDTQDSVISEQDGIKYALVQSYTSNSITTIIPDVYGDPILDIPDFLGVGVEIIYTDNQESIENLSENQFTVIDNALAQGPCIWRLNPNQGYIGDLFNIEGIKFGSLAGAVNMEDWANPLIYNTWAPELIEGVMTPEFSTAGNRDVMVVDNNGYVSNPIPFDIIFDRPEIKEFGCNPPPVYSSPSPYKNSEDACTDIDLVIEFTKDMLDNGPDGVLNINNYTIQNCGTDDIYNIGNCSQIYYNPSVAQFYDPTSRRIVRLSVSSLLTTGTWYTINILSNVKSDENVELAENYSWHFKTRDTDVCPVASIDLTPKDKSIIGCSATQLFTASPMASNCNALTPGSYAYAWSSTDVDVATIGAGNTYQNIASATGAGSTWIRVEETDSLKWTKESLNVNCCSTDQDCYDPDGDNSNRCDGSICDNTYSICTPVINNFNPASGSYDDWVTIQGCWFNNYNASYSQVTFNDELSIVPFDKCTSSAWQNEQIVAQVPENSTNPFGAISMTSAPYGSAFIALSSSNFVSGFSYVGICNLRPTHGILGSITRLTANDNLLEKGTGDDVYYSNQPANGYPGSGWDIINYEITSQVPDDLSLGLLNTRVWQDNIYSNPLNFSVDPTGGSSGDLCVEGCGAGCDTGFSYCSSPYQCLEEIENACTNCRCCCDIGVLNSCNNLDLECLAGQGNCTGIERGLCCGCENDAQCTGAGCGFLDPNRCCHDRPTVPVEVETCTASGGTGAGLNTTFKLTFTKPMDRSRLNNEYIKVSKVGVCGDDDGQYIGGRCYLNGQIVSTNSTNTNTTIFYPNNCKLTINTEYKAEFIVGDDGEGVRSSQGVSYGLTGSSPCTWDNTLNLNCEAFAETTATQELLGFCLIDKVNVEPRDFTIKGQGEHDYSALALDDDNNAVCVSDFTWSSSDENIATVNPAVDLITTATTVNPVNYGYTFITAVTEGISCIALDPLEPYTCGKLKVSPTTLPQVIEQQGCEQCVLGGQSPSPWKDSQENCPNAQIVVRFNREIEASTLTINSNIILKKLVGPDWTAVTIAQGDIIVSPDATTLYIKDTLALNTDYKMTLISGLGGIKDTNGLPLDGNGNDIQDGDPIDNYVWEFETGTTNCALNKVCINPRQTVQLNHPDTQDYYTDTYASNCNYLLASFFNNEYNWTFQPLITDVAEFMPSASPLIGEWEAIIQSLNLGEADVEIKIISNPEINDSVHLIVATNPSVESGLPQGSDVCRNVIISATFNQIMDENTISSDTVQLFGKYDEAGIGLECTLCSSSLTFENLHNKNIFANLYYKLKSFFTKNVGAQVVDCWCELPAEISSYEEDNKTIVKIDKGLLAPELLHKIIIKEGIETKYGIELASDFEWEFTSGKLCELSEIIINPEDIYFNTAGDLENLEARAYDDQGNEIFGVTGYDWDWQWASDNPAVVDITGILTASQTEITSQSQDGLSQITATANLNVGGIPTNTSVIDQIQAQVSICEHTWVYMGSDTNFKFSYCRDNEPLLPRLLLMGEGVVPSGCGNGTINAGEICDVYEGIPAHATCLFDCSDWVCDDGYYEVAGECITKWPFAPSGLLVEVNEVNPDTKINLNWNDNSTNEDGFEIERKILGGVWGGIGTVDPNIIFYNDTGLTEATTYYYKVKAFNIDEDEITYYYSPYCTEALETTGCPERECYEGGNCYEEEECITNTTQMCFEDDWINSCGDGILNCYEICDGVVGNIPGYNTHCQSDCLNWECDAGYDACEGSNSCEENLLTNRLHCGECNNRCGPSQTCENGICIIPSGTIPSVPTNLIAQVNAMYPSSRIDLNWADTSANENGFRIERNISHSSVEIVDLGANITSYNDIGLSSETTYNYKIMAYNNNGDSGYSNTASATTTIMPSYAPLAPANLIGIPDINQIELNWTDNSSEIRQEDGFEVQRFDSGVWGTIASLGIDVTSYIDEGLTSSTIYIYRIRAYNEHGESYSSSIDVTTSPSTTLPDSPSNLDGDIDSINPYDQINLTWDDNSDNEEGFKIERDGIVILTVVANLEQYQDAGLSDSTAYEYKVKATNSVGDSGYSNPITIVTATIPIAPDPPTGLTATAVSSNQIGLTWADNSDNETGFKVEKLDTSVIATLGPNTQSYQHTGLNFNTAYSYKVRAYNDIGSSLSNQATATTNNCLTNHCEYDGICYVDEVCHPNIDIEKCVAANWLTSCGDGSFNCWEFCDGVNTPPHTICNSDCLGWTCEANWGDCTTDSGCETDLTTTSNCGGCGIICNQGAGEICQIGTWICEVASLPDDPSNLVVTANFDEINLTWADNSDNEDGFKIERYLESNLDFTATVGVDVVSYLDAGLIPLTSYFYKIRAYNADGYSSYSNTASATTTCSVDQCEYNGTCYNNGNCYPGNTIEQCVATNWVTSCGINGINCGEVCDGVNTPSHTICNNDCLGFGCENDWGDCDGNTSNGCEEDLLESWLYCGSCAIQCDEANEECIDGNCEYNGPGGGDW